MRADDRKPGLSVRTSGSIGRLRTSFSDPKYLRNRQSDAWGVLLRPLMDDDYWWVQHGDGTIAPYFFSELEVIPDPPKPTTGDDGWGGFPLG